MQQQNTLSSLFSYRKNLDWTLGTLADGSTAFVASCLVISMIAAQNPGRRDVGKGVVSLVKGSGKLI